MVCFHAEKMPHTASALTSPVRSTASVASLLLLCLSRTASLPGLRPLPGRYFPGSCTARPSLHSGVCFVAALTGLPFIKSHSHCHSLFVQPNLFFLNVIPPDVSLLVISSHLLVIACLSSRRRDPRGLGLHFAPHHLPSAWSRLWDVIGTQFFFLLVYRSFLNLKMSIIRVSNRVK